LKETAVERKEKKSSPARGHLLADEESGPRIAIVDDEPQIASLFSVLLKRDGFKVIGLFSNGMELLQSLENAKNVSERATLKQSLPDIVVLDYMMPELDGVETAKRLKAKYPGVKIIMVSAYSLTSYESGERYFDAYLKKPASVKQLLSVITSLCGT